MKLSRAWPCETEKKSEPEKSSEPEKNSVMASAPGKTRVWPKSIVDSIDQTVERSIGSLLKETFPEEDLEDPTVFNVLKTVEREDRLKKFVMPDQNTALWVAFGILAFIVFVAINSLHQKIATMESWLHGRMMSSH